MGLYEVPLYMLGFGMGTMLAKLYICGSMLLLRTVLSILVRYPGPRGLMCFRCMMFSLSGPCELLFLLFTLVYLRWGECNVIALSVFLC